MPRREVLRSFVAGSLLMPGILQQLLADEAGDPADPLAPKAPHFPAKAKNVIFLFMSGGVSHVDSFDPKPNLFADHGKSQARPSRDPQPAGLRADLPQAAAVGVPPARRERHRGQHAVSPRRRLRRRHRPDPVDAHRPLEPLQRHAGHAHRLVHLRPAEPWLLGQLRAGHGEPEPAVVRGHRAGQTYAGTQVWACDFLPGATRGRWSCPARSRCANIVPRTRRATVRSSSSRRWRELNRRHLDRRADDPQLAARIRSFETAFGMQMAVPEASTSPENPTRRSRSTASSPAARRASAGNAWSPAGWSSAACGSSS